MKQYLPALVLSMTLPALAAAHPWFAEITAVDPERGTVMYTITFGKQKDTVIKANVAKTCVIKEGAYRLGKPATTREGDDIAGGLRNALFQKATAEKPLRVNIFTADEDDPNQGIQRGDVLKILVNPPPKGKNP
jgi:hypothetical protein